ncbi:MAG: glycerophosphoryl diester phosphodiesterase membrane domain-containing protein, partial [Leptospiraceae bacterium]|nr:glycerophosphoryl diester phosphodiesterase membrane domain-containing protein [Leptospiraceae bacterium]
FKDQVGPGVIFVLVGMLVALLLTFTIIGYFLLVPHIMAAFSVGGLYMFRRKLALDVLFKGFSFFGSVLGAYYVTFMINMLIQSPVLVPQVIGYVALIRGEISMVEFNQYMMIPGLLSWPLNAVNLWIGTRFMLAMPLILERNYGAIDSLKASWRQTRPFQWWLLLLMFLSTLIGSLGVIACIVGILISLPLGMAIHGAAIAQLLGEDSAPTQKSGDITPTTE